MKSEDTDPFFDALSSYKFKSNDENERMKFWLGTPYEGMVSTATGEKKNMHSMGIKESCPKTFIRKKIYLQTRTSHQSGCKHDQAFTSV